MKVGVPKEIKTLEFRVGMRPSGVHELVVDGHLTVRRDLSRVHRHFCFALGGGEPDGRTVFARDGAEVAAFTFAEEIKADAAGEVAALRDKGYNPGPIDGVLGSQTLKSANAYAKSSGLPFGPTATTLESWPPMSTSTPALLVRWKAPRAWQVISVMARSAPTRLRP